MDAIMRFLKYFVKKFDEFQYLKLCDIDHIFYQNTLLVIFMLMNTPNLKISTSHLCNDEHFYSYDIRME